MRNTIFSESEASFGLTFLGWSVLAGVTTKMEFGIAEALAGEIHHGCSVNFIKR